MCCVRQRNSFKTAATSTEAVPFTNRKAASSSPYLYDLINIKKKKKKKKGIGLSNDKGLNCAWDFESFSKQHSVNPTCNKPAHWACIRRGWSHSSCCGTSEPFLEGRVSNQLDWWDRSYSINGIKFDECAMDCQGEQDVWEGVGSVQPQHTGSVAQDRPRYGSWVVRRQRKRNAVSTCSLKMSFVLKLVKCLTPITGPPQKMCIHFNYLMLYNSYGFMQNLHYNKI